MGNLWLAWRGANVQQLAAHDQERVLSQREFCTELHMYRSCHTARGCARRPGRMYCWPGHPNTHGILPGYVNARSAADAHRHCGDTDHCAESDTLPGGYSESAAAQSLALARAADCAA
jgi:hypothetical protein